MATEKRLIELDGLINNIEWDNDLQKWALRGEPEDIPTVDAVEVPCKIGDSVWGIKIYNHGREAKKGVVHQMFFGEDMRLCICVKNVCRGEWGKNVFATKEETEAALARMDGDGNG